MHDPASDRPRLFPIAYFITFSTYGTRVHGDNRGTVDRAHNTYGTPTLDHDPVREGEERHRMRQRDFILNPEQRASVHQTMHDVATHRGWAILAINVRSTHVHVIVRGAVAPERIMGDFKRWATRRLREARLVEADRLIWTEHGSTQYIWDAEGCAEACDYVKNRQ